ncbi:molybdenum cofactor synthesis domain-containing protein [Georgenia satyanarayanai]|uniref:Molybdenum cofactor synthesis domain-containing protein n=1 Tax=Georgenia satyanarayanai TaxID=860221 RepID=A0A2Y9C319_9MICO|nr:molybdopterin-binding protein [Georgenia satyanarayanai]PYG02217.1 molybdenum cofactor synthesis domain-containing protein [Georgenia satyanarayanai]SSA37053.1 molybdenum cofactor synthesis domain-containing protein [Georgenia satyanarayanai]
MPNPTAAVLVIGDEILSGRTREANAHHLAGELTRVGIDLAEIRVVPDDHEVIVAALNALRERYTHVFTSGGIGPTHDDITADAVAAAFGVGIDVRADARALLEEALAGRGATPTADQLRMARIPDGATLIVNGVSGAPGFSIGNVHVMAGVPSIFVAMLDALLPTLAAGVPIRSREVRFDVGEGRVAAQLRQLAGELPQLTVGSYPFTDGDLRGTNVVVRGTDEALLEDAVARLEAVRATLQGPPGFSAGRGA